MSDQARSGRRRGRETEDRVNIAYRSDDGAEPTELPLKILVLDDFAATALEPEIDQRKAVMVDRDNFNDVMAKQEVEIPLRVPDRLTERGDEGGEFTIRLTPAGLADLTPRGLMAQVPQLREAERHRHRLGEACALLGNYPQLGEQLSEWLRDPARHDRLRGEVGLERSDPGESLFAGSVGMLTELEAIADTGDPALGEAATETIAAMVRHFVAAAQTQVSIASLQLQIASLGERISAQLDELLHHPRFQKTESAWRVLSYLVSRVNTRENTSVEILCVTKEELLDDFEDAPELPQSGLYRIVYSTEYGTFGGKPFGLICANYEFGPSVQDLALLRHCAAVAAVSHAPFVSNASPEFFGESSFERLTVLHLETLFEGQQYARWRSFREAEDSRYVGLCLPRFLLRKPYTPHTSALRSMAYAERIGARSNHCLWGPSSVVMAVRVAHAFAKYRWCVNIIGDADVGGSMRVLVPEYEALGGAGIQIPVEVLVSERKEYELSEQGFIALVGRRAASDACLFSANSVRANQYFAGTDEGRLDALNHRLGSQFPYLFIVTRLAHYIKVLQREPLGGVKDPGELERELNNWIRQYVADMETVSATVRARKPLRQASIKVEEVPGRGDWFRCKVRVRPHFRYMGAAFTLSIGSKLEKGTAS